MAPNPTSDFVTVSGTDGTARIDVLDLWGRTVLLLDEAKDPVVDLGLLPEGIHVLRCGMHTVRVVNQ